MGFENAQALNAASQSKGTILPARGGTQTVFTGDEKKAKQVLKELQDAYKASLEASCMIPTMVDSAMSKAKDFDITTLGLLLTNQIDEVDIPIITRMQGDLYPEDFDSFVTNLSLLKTIPNIDLVLGIPEATEMQELVDKFKEFEALSDT